MPPGTTDSPRHRTASTDTGLMTRGSTVAIAVGWPRCVAGPAPGFQVLQWLGVDACWPVVGPKGGRRLVWYRAVLIG